MGSQGFLAIKLRKRSLQQDGRDDSERKRCKRENAVDLVSQGSKKAKELGIDHNKRFQQLHRELRCPTPQGHWRAFLAGLAKDSTFDCAACAQLASPPPPELLSASGHHFHLVRPRPIQLTRFHAPATFVL